MKILLLDNYDSFTYNLSHYLESLGATVEVIRNDEVELEDVKSFDRIVLSPGPGIPDQAGKLKEIIREFYDKKPILGICLGQQAIAEVFGGSLKQLNEVVHGTATPIHIIVNDEILYSDLPQTIEVGRYHSWVVSPNDLPECLEVTAVDEWQNIMSIRHKTHDVRGVQYHPESIMTPHGMKILENWLKQ